MEAWVTNYEQSSGLTLRPEQRSFLAELARATPRSSLWARGLASFERLSIEGPAEHPVVVCYFRDHKRPGLLLAFDWPLDLGDDSLDWAVWWGNIGERMAEAGSILPTEAGPDGAAHFD